MLTNRGGTGIPGRLISGGGAILRLCSPQYICSSSILLQYMSSSYRLQKRGTDVSLEQKKSLISTGDMSWLPFEVIIYIYKKTFVKLYQKTYCDLITQ